MKEKIHQLENQINEWEYSYRILDNPIVSDQVYDFAKKELEKLSKEYPQFVSENSPLKRIGSVLVDGFEKFAHKHIMGSIDNAYTSEELIEWDKKLSEILGCEPNSLHYSLEDKFDGISGSLHYKNGLLSVAATRGDGEIGDNITNNARMCMNIPIELYDNITCEIRGEFVIFKDQLEKINKAENAEYKNVRNLVSGTMKSLDSNVIKSRNVVFIPYYLFDKDGKECSFDDVPHYKIFSQFWRDSFPTFVTHGGNIEKIIKTLKDFEDKEHHNYYRNRPWLTDGAVIKVTSFSFREQLGYNSSNCPIWAKAFKFSQEKANTKVKSIAWQVGRECITPVAELEPVELEGTTVSRATIHNVTQLKRLNITKDCVVEIEKAGFIIPYINKVVQESTNDIYIPECCPVCNAPTKIVKIESEDLICTNDFCSGKLINNTIYMIKALQIMDVGISIVSELVNKGIIKKQFDLLTLPYETILTLDRMGKNNAKKIHNNIQKALIQPLHRVIQCLGIQFVGESHSERISKKFNSFSSFRSCSVSDLLSIDKIGESTANSIVEYINKNKEVLEELEKLFVIRKDEGYSEILNGQRIVITGAAVKSRDELESLVKKNGGEISSSVSKKTTIVIIGSKEPSNYNSTKKKKAIELNIPVVDEFWLLDQLGIDCNDKKEVENIVIKDDNSVNLNDLF